MPNWMHERNRLSSPRSPVKACAHDNAMLFLVWVFILFRLVCLFVCLSVGIKPDNLYLPPAFVCLFVCLFVWIKPEKQYSATAPGFIFCLFCRHTASAPITSGMHTGAVTGKPGSAQFEGTPEMDLSFSFCWTLDLNAYEHTCRQTK